MPSQLSQNLKALLQEIGEASVLLQLSIRLQAHPEWRAFRNYADHGCDLVLVHAKGEKLRKQLNIEVKTRQSLVTNRSRKNVMHFTLTAREYDSCHFLIAFWFDRNDYFVVPKKDLKPVKSGRKLVYKFIALVSRRSGEYNAESSQYRGDWNRVLSDIEAAA